MTYEYEVYKQQRVALVSFHRAMTGAPKLNFPDIDDRGYFGLGYGLNRGPIVGVSEGSTVFVELRRERIDSQALLFVTSSDPAAMTVSGKEGKEALAQSAHMQLQIKGLKGSGGVEPKVTELEVRYGSKQGVIIGVLSVWIFTELELVITPHLVTIQDKAKTSISPHIDIAAITQMANAIWQPCGVSLTVRELKHDEFTFATAGAVDATYDADTKEEVTRLFAGPNYAAETLNIYFVNKIHDVGDTAEVGTAGKTFNRAYAKSIKINPGSIVAVEDLEEDIPSLASTTAHEIGHFLGLEHVDHRKASEPRLDSWTFRMLMRPGNQLPFKAGWLNDVGYGSLNRGCLITLKDLTDLNNREKNHITDPEWLAPRTILHTDEGPY